MSLAYTFTFTYRAVLQIIADLFLVIFCTQYTQKKIYIFIGASFSLSLLIY